MAQTNYTPIQLYYSTTAAAVPVNTNLLNGELAINITDGKLYYKDNSGTVQVIATKGAGTIGGSTTQIQYNNAGALAGSSAMVFNNSTNVVTLTTLNLTNALGAIYGGTGQSTYTTGDLLYSSAANTLSKLAIGTANYILTVNSGGTNVQWSAPSSISVSTATNLAGGVAGSVPYQSGASTTTFLGIGAADRVMTSSGSAPQWVTALTGLTGVSSSSITNTSLNSGRVVYSGASGVQTDSANLTFNGTTLSAGGFSTTGLSTLVKTVTVGNSNFDGGNAFAPATPAKLYIGTGTVTDMTTPINGNVTTGAITSLAITPIAADKTGVTYTNASTLYIAGAPSAGTNITITNPYALYIAAGASYLGGNTAVNGALSTTGNITNSNSAGRLDFTGASSAQVWATASSLYLDAATGQSVIIRPNNQVTAGTFSSTGLAVTGTISSNNGSANNLLSINGDGAIQSGVQFKANGAGPYTTIYFDNSTNHTYYKNLASGGHLFFNNTTQAMTLDASGNLGIGATSPAKKLDVYLGTTGTVGQYLRNSTINLLSQIDGTSSAQFGTETSHPLVFLTGNTERARIDSSGVFVQRGATTAAGIKPTAIANNESITTVNSTTYTINLGTSAKLFWISLGNGDGALVFTSYISSSITFLGITPANVAATASPSSAQLGISKSANSHDIVIKTGSALSSTAASWQMGVLSSQVA